MEKSRFVASLKNRKSQQYKAHLLAWTHSGYVRTFYLPGAYNVLQCSIVV